MKTWSARQGDVRAVSRLLTFGLPALAFFEAMPHASVDMRDQFADLFTVLQVTSFSSVIRSCTDVRLPVFPTYAVFPSCWQDGRDFADVVSPKLNLIFGMAADNRFYLRVIQHLVECDTRTTGTVIFILRIYLLQGAPNQIDLSFLPTIAVARSGVNRYMIALLIQFIVCERKLETVMVRCQTQEGEDSCLLLSTDEHDFAKTSPGLVWNFTFLTTGPRVKTRTTRS